MSDNTVGNGRVFTADLVDIHRLGTEVFPEVATVYSGFSAELDEQRGPMYGALSTFLPAGRRVLAELIFHHSHLQAALAQTSTNLADTGTVLVEIARDYALTDEDVTADFDARLAELEPAPPVAVPAPTYPSSPDDGR